MKKAITVLFIIFLAPIASDAGYVDSVEVYLKEAGHSFSANDFPKAMRLFKKALDFDSTSVNALTNIGVLFSLKSAHDSSLYYLNLAKKYDPNDASIHNSLGIELAATGDSAAALESFLVAINLKDDNADFFLNAGTLLNAMLRFQEASAHLKKAYILDTADAEISYNLGNSYIGLKNNAEAEICFERAVGQKPSNINYLYNLGFSQLNLGKFPEAIVTLKKVTAMNPDHFDANLRMGTAYAMQTKFDSALVVFKKCVALDPKSDEAMIFMGASHYFLNQMTEAEEIYNYLKDNRPEAADKMMKIINPQGN